MARIDWPDTITFNAFTGEGPVAGAIGPGIERWIEGPEAAQVSSGATTRAPKPDADLWDWKDPRVGWGLILPDDESQSEAVLASGDDAPEPIRRLLRERAPAGKAHAPVLRYHAGSDANRLGFLRNYADMNAPDIASSDAGTELGQIPKYLLIYGSPLEVRWDLQYVLNTRCFVGRLDIEGDALKRYVDALLDGWSGARSDLRQPLVWSVDDRVTAITRLMRDLIAAPVAEQYAADADLAAGTLFMDGSAEKLRAAELIQALADRRPGVIVSTSHGMTGPLNDPPAMARDLGLPVDAHDQLVRPADLLAAWQPDGAVWYAHACCSAGGDGVSRLAGALEPGSSARRTLEGVAAAGALVAPLPRALLGADKPLRAFIGQVEPTADWTLKNSKTGQALTGALRKSLYNNLYASPPRPVGLAMADAYTRVGTLMSTYLNAQIAGGGAGQRPEMAHVLLAALDQQSMVILGDPTAVLPPLAAA